MNPESLQPNNITGYQDLEMSARDQLNRLSILPDDFFDNYIKDDESDSAEQSEMLISNIDALAELYMNQINDEQTRRTLTEKAFMYSVCLSHWLSDGGEWGVNTERVPVDCSAEQIEYIFFRAPQIYLEQRQALSQIIAKYMPRICPDQKHWESLRLLIGFNLMNVEAFLLKVYEDREVGKFSMELKNWNGQL